MRARTLALVASLALALCAGCRTPGIPAGSNCQPAPERQEGPTIHVKAPPQRITIEDMECVPNPEPCKPPPTESQPKSPESKPEAKKEAARPESAPRREA